MSTHRWIVPATCLDVLVVSGEEARRGGTVSVKGHAVLAQHGDEILFGASHDGVVLPLVDARLDESALLANVNEPLDFLGRVVGDAPAADLALAERPVHGLARLLERRRPVRHVQVLDVDLVDPEGFEGDVNLPEHLFLGVGSGLPRRNLCVDGESVAGGRGAEARLGGAGRVGRVHARRVDLGVASLGEDVEEAVYLVGGVEAGHRVDRGVPDLCFV